MLFKIIDIASSESELLENGRGDTIKLVDSSLGTEKIDLHLNRLLAGGAKGRLHRHSRSDNVYIVRKGEGILRIEEEKHVIREGQVIYIRAGVRHSLSNESDTIFEIFEIYAPAGAAFDFIVDEPSQG